MSPFLIQNHAIAIGAYPFFYGLGLVCAGIVEGLLLGRRGFRFRDGIRGWGIVCLLIVFGGRVLYTLIYWSTEDLSATWFVTFNGGGEVLYGGLIFGTLGGWYVCRYLKLPAGEALDAAAVGTPLGIAIGRVGCLLKGCCHGARCDWWCGIRYPKVIDIYGNQIGSAAFIEQVEAHQISESDSWSLPVHPVPIYESIVLLCVAGVMFAIWRRRVLPGRLMFVFGATYAVWRFAVEFVRVHERLFGWITIYQMISVGVFTACVAGCLLLKPAQLVAPGTGRVAMNSQRRRTKERSARQSRRGEGTERRQF